MELDTIVENLNKKMTSQGVDIDNLDDLTEVEKDFIEKYTPQQSLIVYGTLAPNRPNHSKIEHIKGEWHKGIVKGKLVKEGWGAALGYFGFKNAPPEEQENIEAYMLVSKALTDHWPFLDAFEGPEYKRTLVKFEWANGEISVGYIYSINDN
jgi:gamma-glutamylcyclotransferase (GGCT)/AIG2-like uncharacterized protein YtfP